MRSNNRIRKITETILGKEPYSMVYSVGQPVKLPIGGKSTKRTITDIIETELYFKIYLTDNEVTKEWVNIPVCDRVKKEYFIE